MATPTRFTQGIYVPRNPHKYVGDASNIRYMSSYELETHSFLDNNQRVLRWSSEEIAIPYVKPTDGRVHKYYPDYWVEYINKFDEVICEVLEVKPAAQAKAPRGNRKSSVYEQLTWAVNQAKWEAAVNFCNQQGWKFRIITERSIFR